MVTTDSEALVARNQRHEKIPGMSELVAEKTLVALSWVSVRDRLPFNGHECVLICRNPNSNELRRAIGCRLHGNWEIEDCALVNCDVRAWLKLPSTPSDI